MNYEFHVGDYVETWDEWVGYVESIHDLLHGVTGLYVRFTDDDCHCFEVTNKTISSNFLRIGAYDFTKKEKKKIENLVKPQWDIPVEDLIDKINELVDAVNKLMDKEEDR